jgi:hypothetical protein
MYVRCSLHLHCISGADLERRQGWFAAKKKAKLQNSNMNDIVVAESVKKKNLTRDRKMWKEGEILV